MHLDRPLAACLAHLDEQGRPGRVDLEAVQQQLLLHRGGSTGQYMDRCAMGHSDVPLPVLCVHCSLDVSIHPCIYMYYGCITYGIAGMGGVG